MAKTYPIAVSDFDTVVSVLKKHYEELRWDKKLYFSAELARELINYSVTEAKNEDKLRIFIIFQKTNSFFQKNLFSLRRDFYNNPLIRALRTAYKEGFLNGYKAQANFNLIINHPAPDNVNDILCILKKTDLLRGNKAQDNFVTVAKHEETGAIYDAIYTLSDAGLIMDEDAQDNFDAVLTHKKPGLVAEAIVGLKSLGLLTKENARVNRDAVVAHQEPYTFANALFVLNTAGLLTGEAAQVNRDAIAKHEKPFALAKVLVMLKKVGLLTGEAAQTNRGIVTSHEKLDVVAAALVVLERANLLTEQVAQTNFNALLAHGAVLLHENNNFWHQIPHGGLTAAEFQTMITIAQDHAGNPGAGRVELLAYVDEAILGINRAFNPTQSSHTASVHASASESATKLLMRYGAQIAGDGLSRRINECASWIKDALVQNPDNIAYQAAARCIERLIKLINTKDIYRDPASGVTIQQLVVLAWSAIHDETARAGAIEDAQKQLLEGLYEIQRGYNLSAKGDDDGDLSDKIICNGGAFNKICEKLTGIHPDVDVLYITKEGAAKKFPIVVVEEAQKYINTLVYGTKEFLALYKNIRKENMEPLWNMISSAVAVRMFDEFGSLYPEGKTSTSFTQDLEQGIYALRKDKLILPAASVNSSMVSNSHSTLFHHNNNDADEQEINNQPQP